MLNQTKQAAQRRLDRIGLDALYKLIQDDLSKNPESLAMQGYMTLVSAISGGRPESIEFRKRIIEIRDLIC